MKPDSKPSPADDPVVLAVTGMTCAACAARIEKKLNKLDGMVATVNYATSKATVTGLLNRRGFFLNLNAVRDRVVTDQSTSVLMYCDLDHFKDVNDAIGHDAGDEVLRAVATAMQAAVRDRDTVARIGGDEFAVIVNNCDMEQARRVAEAVHASVHECTADLAGRMWDARMSIGMVPISGADAPGVDELLRAADAACYDAKRGGRDRIHVAP